MRNAGQEAAPAGIKIARRNNNNLRYADDTTLMAESEEELKSLLMKVKEELLMAFLFVFFFWDSYDSNVGAFHIVPEVTEVVLISFDSFFFFPLC